MNSKKNEIVLLLYDFDDPVKMGQIVKIMYDFGVREMEIVADDDIDNESMKIIEKYAQEGFGNLYFSQNCIAELAAGYKEEDGFKVVGFSDSKPNQSCFETNLTGKICLVVGVNENNCHCFKYLDKEFDKKLFFPKEISENPDEISRAIALLNCIHK